MLNGFGLKAKIPTQKQEKHLSVNTPMLLPLI